ncbi:hypothetical protein SK128_012270 [Halocaridina rubra]|uniref:Uncharacterized protein n=2 Tax=Halocaridina rubra TaxID=373956 RepID=A0AAN8XG03_HALRR
MLRVLSVLCLVVAAQAWGGNEDMMKKYAYSKIMSNCFGEEFVMNWKMQMKAACDVCEGKDVMQTVVDLQKMVKELQKKYSPFRAAASQQPMYVPVPYYQAQPYFVPQSFRTKRSMHDLSPEGMQMMKEKLMMKMSNVTCVMKEMKYITEDNQPNYEYFNEELNKMNIDEGLREDMREAMDMCRDFAMCLPVEKARSPMKKELGTAMGFMKCMHMKKAMVCMKHDMKKYAAMMGMEGGDMEEASMMGETKSMMDEMADMMMGDGDMM